MFIYTHKWSEKRIREQNVNMHQQKQRSMGRLKELAGRIVHRSTIYNSIHEMKKKKTTHILDIGQQTEKNTPRPKLNQQITHWKYDTHTDTHFCLRLFDVAIMQTHSWAHNFIEPKYVGQKMKNEWNSYGVKKNHYIDSWLMREHLSQAAKIINVLYTMQCKRIISIS